MLRVRSMMAGALVAAVLALGALHARAADQPTGPTVVVEAPADPAVRAALQFPPGWRLEAARDELAPRFVNALGIDERCEFATRRSEFPDLATDVGDLVVGLAPGSRFIFIARETVELPAATVERVDFASKEEGGRWSVYSAWREGYVHELWCRGDELPDDRWLPIVETLDLAPDETLVSSDFDPVVTRPDAGVAMSFPEAWHVRGSSTSQGLLYATSDTAVCALSDYSRLAEENGWRTLEAMHEEYVASVEARDDVSLEESTYLDLPAGRAGLADIIFADGTRAIRWSFGSGDGRLLALFCVGQPTPDDRYLSLAESLEWLEPG
jgi:hypothetical protein